MSEVVVLGGGLAGAAAALELASRDVPVRLVRAGPGATALCWGTVEIAGASPDRDGLPLRGGVSGRELTPAERLAYCLRTKPRHPYVAIFGGSGTQIVETAANDAVKSAASRLDGWLAPAGLRVGGGVESTRYLANLRGAVRAADLVLSGPDEGQLQGARELVLADMPGLAHYDARPAARQLAAELEAMGLARPPIRILSLALPPALAGLASAPARLAAQLDEPAAAAALADALREAVRASAGGRGFPREGLLLLPPLLGLATTASLVARLREAAGVRVAELLGATPLAPAGLRLDRALQAALAHAGVPLLAGRARRIDVSGGRATAVQVMPAGAASGVQPERIEASAVVLATGRFVGGGLVERNGRLLEPLLDLPLFDERDARVDGVSPRRLLRSGHDDPQSLLSAGVRVDERLRPLARDGAAAADNVYAAGDLIGGCDPARDRTGLGVALLSGLRAGVEAAREREVPARRGATGRGSRAG